MIVKPGAVVVALTLTVLLLAIRQPQGAVFRGRLLLPQGSMPLTQVRVVLEGQGATTPSADGSFSIGIPAGTKTVVLRVEVGDRRLQVTYPPNPVNVPLDGAAVTQVLVGPSTEAVLAEVLGAQRAKIEAGFKAAGVSDSLIIAAIAALTRQIAEGANIEAAALNTAAARAQKRSEMYPVISEALETYDVKVNNVQQAFRYIIGPSFSSDAAFAQLKLAITEYNPAFETLRTRRGAMEAAVKEYWDDRRWTELRAVFDLALGDVHRVHVLPLNALLPKVDSVLRGKLRDNAATRAQAEVLSEVQRFLAGIVPRLDQFAEKKTRLLADLQVP